MTYFPDVNTAWKIGATILGALVSAGVAVFIFLKKRGKPAPVAIREQSAEEVFTIVEAVPPLSREQLFKHSFGGRWVQWSGVVSGVAHSHDGGFSITLDSITQQSTASALVFLPKSEREAVERIRPATLLSSQAFPGALKIQANDLDQADDLHQIDDPSRQATSGPALGLLRRSAARFLHRDQAVHRVLEVDLIRSRVELGGGDGSVPEEPLHRDGSTRCSRTRTVPTVCRST